MPDNNGTSNAADHRVYAAGIVLDMRLFVKSYFHSTSYEIGTSSVEIWLGLSIMFSIFGIRLL